MYQDTVFFVRSLGIEGTLDQLIDWSYRYDRDYSDEALEKISEIAKDAHWISEEKKKIPGLVLQARKREKRNDGTLPYEQMKLDQIIYGKIRFGETKEYGEVEINTEREKVLITVQGSDNGKPFTAYDAFYIEEFMSGDADWLEKTVGRILYLSNRE